MVGVADRRVELGEYSFSAVVQAIGERGHEPGEGGNVEVAHRVAQAPQRNAAVFTGASQSRIMSSSSFSSVIEQPAISSEVM